MDKKRKYDDLIAYWKTDAKTRQGLIARIREEATKSASPNYTNLFTEQRIAEQYYKSWLDLPPSSSLQKIAQHPLLDKQMKQKIDEQMWEQKQGMLKWAAGLTALCVVLYSTFFSRMPRFAKFFNHPDSYMITRGVKKTVGVYGMFLCWVASLTSTYEKGLPEELEKKGLTKDLEIFIKIAKD